ncbi:MAG: hypothetical protein CVT73_21935 [Alphaproteobacteria bacterium HGW-Alphaproteobacteria-12]|nr:MAG: hypothetical protein CVT73_21935 [Alphaproteobacteria bacterium HGW-Alphaproteobacteria-12]
MAIGSERVVNFLKRRLFFRQASGTRESLEALLRRAAEADGFSRAPGGLAGRIADVALAAPASRPAAIDLSGFLLRPRIVGASLASFSMGAALAVCLIDIQAGALVRTLMVGVMQSVTTGGYL